ncbi:DUF5105 domain-containing protein [Bacillus sp. NPDC094106]|uniref:DUF5105 domain-containing protein n=1 Tax=Bacillus sp. NPDC094106 TaxID=3363949 RepID=UPI0038274A76
MKKLASICITAVLMAGIVSGCNTKKTSSEPEKPKTVEVGKTAKLKGVEVQVESAEFVLPDRYSKSNNGQVLKVKVSLKNTGEETLHMIPRDFTLYQDDQVAKEYFGSANDMLNPGDLDKGKKIEGNMYFDVKEASSYELVYKKYSEDVKKDGKEKVTYKIDGKKLSEQAKGLQKPAEALNAYVNAAFYDKDIDKLKKLTGEDSSQFISDVENGFKQQMEREIGKKVDDQLLSQFLKNLKAAIQKNVKYETKVLSSKDGKAEVELKGKPMDVSALQSPMQTEMMKLASQNPNISEDDLMKAIFETYNKLLQDVKLSYAEEEVTVKMVQKGKDQWTIDPQSAAQIGRVFIR